MNPIDPNPLDWSACPELIRNAGKYADVFGIYYGVEYYEFLESPDFPLELAIEANQYFFDHYKVIEKFIDDNDYTDQSGYFKKHSWRCEMTIHLLALANDYKKFVE